MRQWLGARSVARVVSNKLGLDLHLSARHLTPTVPKGQDPLQPEAKAAPSQAVAAVLNVLQVPLTLVGLL